MQWIFMLVGLLLGALADESVVGAILGAVVGLAIGQALKLQQLEKRNAALTDQLRAFSTRFEQGTTALYERLLKLEQGVAPSRQWRHGRRKPSRLDPSWTGASISNCPKLIRSRPHRPRLVRPKQICVPSPPRSPLPRGWPNGR